MKKIIWMQLLLIGTLSSFQSCNKGGEDKVYYEEYHLTNKSDYEIVIKSFNKTDDGYEKTNFSINRDGSVYQMVELNFGSTTGIIAYADSVVLQFGNDKHISFNPDIQSAYNILDRKNYSETKKSENKTEYRYTFTNEDYDNASTLD